jgi:hypothetical protein
MQAIGSSGGECENRSGNRDQLAGTPRNAKPLELYV